MSGNIKEKETGADVKEDGEMERKRPVEDKGKRKIIKKL